MWKTILCGFVIVVASTAVSGQSVTSGAGTEDVSRGEMLVAQQDVRPASVIKAHYDARCGANARRVQVDLRGSIDGGARCLRESREEE